MIDLQAEAVRILDARAQRRTLSPISDRLDLSLDQAYALQALLTQVRIDRGERIVGWKLGYTSPVMREQMGIGEPNFGPLTDAMLLANGDAVPKTLIQPRVEPEVALRFARAVEPGADRAAVLSCVGAAYASLEVVDSVWTDYRFRLTDNTADGSSAAAVVLGPEIPVEAIESVEVTLFVDDVRAGTGQGRDASGHPADGVVWLIGQLARRGLRLRAGDLVITGGLTRAAPLDPGSTIRACFSAAGAQAKVRRER